MDSLSQTKATGNSPPLKQRLLHFFPSHSNPITRDSIEWHVTRRLSVTHEQKTGISLIQEMILSPFLSLCPCNLNLIILSPCLVRIPLHSQFFVSCHFEHQALVNCLNLRSFKWPQVFCFSQDKFLGDYMNNSRTLMNGREFNLSFLGPEIYWTKRLQWSRISIVLIFQDPRNESV